MPRLGRGRGKDNDQPTRATPAREEGDILAPHLPDIGSGLLPAP